MAATLGNYYIDGDTLATATAVFDDIDLTICAADGFYSDGTIVRQQFNCSLLNAATCPSCNTSCASTITVGGNTGIYNLTFDTGTDLGAMLIYFRPQSVPDGIRVLFDAVTYNEVTSPNFGYLASATPGNYVVLGATASDCTPGIAATLNAGGYSNLDEYEYNVVTSQYDLIGNSGVVTGTGTDVNLTAGPPGYCTLVIPRPTNIANTCLVSVVGFCGTQWDLEINCPVVLTATPMGVEGVNCGATEGACYAAPNRGGTAGEPAVFEFVFTDGSGQTKIPAGTYTINPPSGQKQMTVDANGVITNLVNCP